ncbi:hypothetical protein [Sphingomonas sp. TREG-RG-20F-R18-01]|uniref:hypothetical protein n=1 Tax=Sphingomonas sp. TREG-RG-20F-R18-01 TaxID=2914982 RepID=UPI001F5AB642|nr:hypothetical protein [Sphingomonas sp. TREG-RG-20F-R18-01]
MIDDLYTKVNYTLKPAAISPTKFVTSDLLVDQVEDWSEVRSPSRARRRMKQGHRQNVHHRVVPSSKVIQQGDTMVMHPATLDALQKVLDKQTMDYVDKQFLNALYGGVVR